MTDVPNSAAPHHLPFFITAPAETDILLVAMFLFLVAAVLFIGNIYFQLHALPEHLAHKVNHMQMQVVAVLALLAMFTHNNLFWIAALLLALVQLPDFSTPINSIADSLEKLAGGRKPFPPPPANARAIDEEPLPHDVFAARAKVSSPERLPASGRPAKGSPAKTKPYQNGGSIARDKVPKGKA
jgi:hypothetical protein